MLNKLLKKDFQATARTFLPLILGFLIVSILAKILFEVVLLSSPDPFNKYVSSTNEFMKIISILVFALYIFYVIAYSIMTYVFLITDFYKTVVSEQGYLTHTLPVKTSTILNSKLLISVFWQFVTGILIFLSFYLFIAGHITPIIWAEMSREFYDILGITIPQYIGFMLICLALSAVSGPLMFYTCIAIGHLFGKYRIVGAILSYLGIYTVLQIISVIAMVGMGYSMISSYDFTDPYSTSTVFSSTFSSLLWFTVISTVVTGVAFYVITNYVLSKKLNLE